MAAPERVFVLGVGRWGGWLWAGAFGRGYCRVMGKKAQRKREAQGKPATRPAPGVAEVEASRELVAALHRWYRVVERRSGEHVAMPSAFVTLHGLVASGEVVAQVEEWAAAWEVIGSGAEVSAVVPYWDRMTGELRGGSRRWYGPQRPDQILDLVDASPALGEGSSYLEQFAINERHREEGEAKRDADLAHECGATTANGSCRSRPVSMPGGRAGGLCWRHLSARQRGVVEAAWDAAVSQHDCPGCVAMAGRKCFSGEDGRGKLRVVDGRWPRMRQFSGRHVHQERLDLVERPELGED